MRKILYTVAVGCLLATGALAAAPSPASATPLPQCNVECQHGKCGADWWFWEEGCSCSCTVQGLPVCDCQAS